MRICVLIPAFNEEESIGEVMVRIPRNIVDTLIVIDDGSRDSTVLKAMNSGADKVVKLKSNKGVGKAFQVGINAALEHNPDIIVTLDADGQHDPIDIPKLVEPIENGEADFVIGSRFLEETKQSNMNWIKNLGNRVFSKILSIIIGKKITDSQSGFRAYSKEAALKLTAVGRFTYTQEAIMDLVFKGLTLKEVPITVDERNNGKSRVVKSWYNYTSKALSIIIKTLRDYRPFLFFGSISLLFLLIGLASGLFVTYNWFVTGRTSPFTSLIPITVGMLVIGFMLGILALFADMFTRQRLLQEEILYRTKKLTIDQKTKKEEYEIILQDVIRHQIQNLQLDHKSRQ
ncbi:MAG: glycosyltransferase family 2 protein [Candidatus Bathyarchaeota archaeon]|jgi:glycosyltransferase involved in cell wall biosynthesis